MKTKGMDPTANVLALVVAETKRHDDLRAMAIATTEKLAGAESRRVDEQLRLRAEYDEKLREAEAKRIDAIRAVDVAAVAVANERTIQQASVLASQVANSSENLRALVISTADTVAKSLAVTVAQLSDRITLLEQSKYRIAGHTEQQGEHQGQSNANRTVLLTITLAVIGQLIGLLYVLLK